jgi:hypothetical protein
MVRAKTKGKLGCACKLSPPRGMAAGAATTGLEPRDFSIPEPAVNGIILSAGLVTGLLGWNNRDKPLGPVLISLGGGLGALGIAFFIREIFTRRPA